MGYGVNQNEWKRSAAGHAANAGMNTSGAGGLYPIEAWGLIVLYNKA